MKIPKQAQRQANILFKACTANGVVDFKKVLLLIDLLLEKKPREWKFIAEHIKMRVRLEKHKRTVQIQSAIKLDEAQKKNIIRSIQQNNNQPLDFVFSVHPEILGGLRIQIGWQVLDASIRAKLESIL